MNDNVVQIPRATVNLQISSPVVGHGNAAVDPDVLVNLMNFCARVEEGMQHITAALVAMESRLKRLELAQRKAERANAGAILNSNGERILRS